MVAAWVVLEQFDQLVQQDPAQGLGVVAVEFGESVREGGRGGGAAAQVGQERVVDPSSAADAEGDEHAVQDAESLAGAEEFADVAEARGALGGLQVGVAGGQGGEGEGGQRLGQA
jgi:hypothetical protein